MQTRSATAYKIAAGDQVYWMRQREPDRLLGQNLTKYTFGHVLAVNGRKALVEFSNYNHIAVWIKLSNLIKREEQHTMFVITEILKDRLFNGGLLGAFKGLWWLLLSVVTFGAIAYSLHKEEMNFNVWALHLSGLLIGVALLRYCLKVTQQSTAHLVGTYLGHRHLSAKALLLKGFGNMSMGVLIVMCTFGLQLNHGDSVVPAVTGAIWLAAFITYSVYFNMRTQDPLVRKAREAAFRNSAK